MKNKGENHLKFRLVGSFFLLDKKIKGKRWFKIQKEKWRNLVTLGDKI